MKNVNVISIEDQVRDMLDLINLLDNVNFETLYVAKKERVATFRMLKKLNQYERHFLLERIERLR
jgi:hypothetical protein